MIPWKTTQKNRPWYPKILPIPFCVPFLPLWTLWVNPSEPSLLEFHATLDAPT